MARIAGVDIPREKQVLFSLQYIHGIGPSGSKKILTDAEDRSDQEGQGPY